MMATVLPGESRMIRDRMCSGYFVSVFCSRNIVSQAGSDQSRVPGLENLSACHCFFCISCNSMKHNSQVFWGKLLRGCKITLITAHPGPPTRPADVAKSWPWAPLQLVSKCSKTVQFICWCSVLKPCQCCWRKTLANHMHTQSESNGYWAAHSPQESEKVVISKICRIFIFELLKLNTKKRQNKPEF